MRIEPVTEENVAYFVQLAKELTAAGSFGVDGPEFVWDFTIEMVSKCAAMPAYYVRLAYDDDDKPCGIVAGHVLTFYFNPALMAHEDAWFVREGTPGRTKIAMALMRGFVDWAMNEMKCVLVETGDIASIDSYAVRQLYKHMGFKDFGAVYAYRGTK
jgi:hypothetical protein